MEEPKRLIVPYSMYILINSHLLMNNARPTIPGPGWLSHTYCMMSHTRHGGSGLRDRFTSHSCSRRDKQPSCTVTSPPIIIICRCQRADQATMLSNFEQTRGSSLLKLEFQAHISIRRAAAEMFVAITNCKFN